MDWFQSAKIDRINGMGIQSIATKYNKPFKTVQSAFYRDKQRGNVINLPQKQAVKTDNSSLQDNIIKDLQKECAINALCCKYKQSPRIIQAVIDDIKDAGYQVQDHNGILKLCRDIVPQENEHTENWNGEQIIRFGVVSDCHLGSKWQQVTFLNHLYDLFAAEGITTVYNPGDLTEGFKMRPGHEHEIFLMGADEQAAYVIDKYPKRDNIVTKFITGNHDHSHIKNGGADIGKPIAKARPDMVYLGMGNAKVYITPNCTVELNHPLDGAAYALSYAPQKTIDAMMGGEKPNILLNGHHHKAFYMLYRNIHSYEAGTTQAQTPWMRGKRIAANMGGWIIEVHVTEDGTITRCKGELIPLYKPLEHDYK